MQPMVLKHRIDVSHRKHFCQQKKKNYNKEALCLVWRLYSYVCLKSHICLKSCSMYAEDQDDLMVSPLLGNVCFASSYYRFCFTLNSFSKIYADTYGNKHFFCIAIKLFCDLNSYCLCTNILYFVSLV